MKLFAKTRIILWRIVSLCAGLSVFTVLLLLSVSMSAIGTSRGGADIVYMLKPGEHGYTVTVQHGLIAAREDLSGVYSWEEAKAACGRLEENGYHDWYLPSKDELNKLYQNKVVIGGFSDADYWSSSESDVNYACSQHFIDGYFDYTVKEKKLRVRPVRAF